MNTRRLIRQIHYWISLAVFIPCGIMFVAGILLMLKKEINWIQPPTQKGAVVKTIPTASYADLLIAAQSRPEAGIVEWSDIDKIDLRPSKGIAKLVSQTGWEVQIDTSTATVLSAKFRRSDVIESLHDGSYFTGWTKLYLFLPIGVLLVFMWGTGMYLFIITEQQKQKKRARKRLKAKPSSIKPSTNTPHPLDPPQT